MRMCTKPISCVLGCWVVLLLVVVVGCEWGIGLRGVGVGGGGSLLAGVCLCVVCGGGGWWEEAPVSFPLTLPPSLTD
jgi:hypothetical protein